MGCKLIEPVSGNEICEYKGLFFVRRRHRNGEFYKPEKWLGITKDYYELFRDAGSVVREAPEQVKEYVKIKYGGEL